MTTSYDCGHYTGRKRQICEGTESDGSPLRMSPRKRAEYLHRWGTPWSGDDPMREPEPDPGQLHGAPSPQPQRRRGKPGDELERILRERGYVVQRECSCRDRIEKMNRWGIEGCRKNIDIIIGWLIESATESGGIKAAVIRFPGLSLIGRHELRKIVGLAIDRAEASEH